MNRALMFGMVALVLAALIGGFMVVGGPSYARLEKQDAERAKDLQGLYVYLTCRSSDAVLPQTLEDPDYCPSQAQVISTKDPATHESYEYRRLDDASFEVCATFVTHSQKGSRGYPYRTLTFEGQLGCRKGVTSSSQAGIQRMQQFSVQPIK
ncbi:MAG: hypothetical protein WA790_11570 [Sulfitobacter sp.]